MENTIAASIALVAWRLMELYGENPVEYAEAKGLSREQLEDSRFRMSYQDCDDLWRCAERVPPLLAWSAACARWRGLCARVLGRACECLPAVASAIACSCALLVCNMICANGALMCKAGSMLFHMARGVRVRRVRLNQ